MVTWRRQKQADEVVFRGNINVPSGQRWPRRWTAVFPAGRLAVSGSGISLWAHSLATVGIGPTFSAKREEVQVCERDLLFIHGIKFVAGSQHAYFWTLTRTGVLKLLEEYGYGVER
jgi:hypothetical protein